MTAGQVEVFLLSFGIKRFKVIETKGIVLFRLADQLPLHFFQEMDNYRPVGVQYAFEPLGFFECRFVKKQWVRKF